MRQDNFAQCCNKANPFSSSSVTIKQILLGCLVHPHFLHQPDGRKFLSCLFGLAQPFVDQLHEAIKGQVLDKLHRAIIFSTYLLISISYPFARNHYVWPTRRYTLGPGRQLPVPIYSKWVFSFYTYPLSVSLCQHLPIIEYTCIQDLMTCAVHAANRNVVASLRAVLGYLHEQKHQRGVLILTLLLTFFLFYLFYLFCGIFWIKW